MNYLLKITGRVISNSLSTLSAYPVSMEGEPTEDIKGGRACGNSPADFISIHYQLCLHTPY